MKCEHAPIPYGVAIWREDEDKAPDVDEIKHMLCESVDRTVAHSDSSTEFFLVVPLPVNQKDPIFAAMTGNGPNSRDTAYFIANACNCHEILFEACVLAREFIRNGIDYGYIKMPDSENDSAQKTPHILDDAIHAAGGGGEETCLKF